MVRLRGDALPEHDDVTLVLGALVEATRGTAWHAALTVQSRNVVGVTGSHWYAGLVLAEGVPPVPDETPNPCASLVSREGVVPWGTVLLWLDHGTGKIGCIEYAAVEMADVDHYPRPGELEADGHAPAPTEAVPADLALVMASAVELRTSMRGLPEADAQWRVVLDELCCDLQVHLAACAGRAGVDGALHAVDVAAVDHTLDHVREVRRARLAEEQVPVESFSGCGCAAGAWLCPPVEALPDDRGGWPSLRDARGRRPRARWWRWVLGVVGFLVLVAVMSVVAVAMGPPWQQVLVPGVVGVLAGTVFAARSRDDGMAGGRAGSIRRSGSGGRAGAGRDGSRRYEGSVR